MNLSIITVCFNVEDTIEKTMNSILNQTVPVYEYILIDGGSTDRTNEIIEKKREEFEAKGIKYVHVSEPDAGISDAFNKGINISTGDVVGLINSDDELFLDTNKILENNYDFETDVWYGNCLWIDEENNIEYERKAHPELLSNLRYEMVLIHPSTFVRGSAYRRYGTFKIQYRHCMDEELLTRFYENGAKFKYINKKLTVFRAGGISDKGIRKTLKEGLMLALDTQKPNYIKAYFAYIYKYVRYSISSIVKKCHFYKFIKKDVKNIGEEN